MAARRFPHPMARDGLSESISGLASDSTRLVQLEIALLKQELAELAKRNAIAVALLLGAGVSAFLSLIFLVVWVIVLVPHHAWAAIVVTLLFLAGAVTLGLIGRTRIKIAPPEATIQTIKEDLEWVKQQIKPVPK